MDNPAPISRFAACLFLMHGGSSSQILSEDTTITTRDAPTQNTCHRICFYTTKCIFTPYQKNHGCFLTPDSFWMMRRVVLTSETQGLPISRSIIRRFPILLGMRDVRDGKSFPTTTSAKRPSAGWTINRMLSSLLRLVNMSSS